MNTTSKEQIIELLNAWINQRPGLEFANYGERKSYFSEMRRITAQLHDARALIRAVELSSITADKLADAFRAFSGRLTLTEKDGKARLDYCAGQYWPTEYRAAACAVLAAALWEHYREDFDIQGAENKGDAIRSKFRRMFGKGIQNRWFN